MLVLGGDISKVRFDWLSTNAGASGVLIIITAAILLALSISAEGTNHDAVLILVQAPTGGHARAGTGGLMTARSVDVNMAGRPAPRA